MTWQIGIVANGGIGITFLLIALAIITPLVRSHQVRSHPLGATTAAIFLTGAFHHGILATYLLLPQVGFAGTGGMDLRLGWGWPLVLWDVLGLLVGVHYFKLRQHLSPYLDQARLMEDVRARDQQSMERHDTMLQSLVVAKMALDLNDPEQAKIVLETSINSASGMMTELLGTGPTAGTLRRHSPADVMLSKRRTRLPR